MNSIKTTISIFLALTMLVSWAPDVQALGGAGSCDIVAGNDNSPLLAWPAASTTARLSISNTTEGRATVVLQGAKTYVFIVKQVPVNHQYIILPGSYRYTITTICGTFKGTILVKTRAKIKLACTKKK
jgi:hypothetical protein